MKRSLFALFALVAVSQIAACASEEDATRWAAGDEAEEALISTGGGTGGLGFACTSTRCECTPGGDGTDRETCIGMDEVCHSHGATVNCTYPPSGFDECHCDFTAVKSPTLRTRVVSSGTLLAR
jgi:hypothetical protein